MTASAQARPSAPPAGDAQLMLQAALVYVQRFDFPVFPCRPNKKPYTEHGFKDATMDIAEVKALWKQYPGALIGIPTGAAGIRFMRVYQPIRMRHSGVIKFSNNL